jgi:hypothetical protein
MRVSTMLVVVGVFLMLASRMNGTPTCDTEPRVEYRYLPRDLDMQMKDAESLGEVVGDIFTGQDPFFQGRENY